MATIVTENDIIYIFQLQTLNNKVLNQAEVWYRNMLTLRHVTDPLPSVARGNIYIYIYIYTYIHTHTYISNLCIWGIHIERGIFIYTYISPPYIYIYIYIYKTWTLCSSNLYWIRSQIQGVTGGTDQTSGGCSLC